MTTNVVTHVVENATGRAVTTIANFKNGGKNLDFFKKQNYFINRSTDQCHIIVFCFVLFYKQEKFIRM